MNVTHVEFCSKNDDFISDIIIDPCFRESVVAWNKTLINSYLTFPHYDCDDYVLNYGLMDGSNITFYAFPDKNQYLLTMEMSGDYQDYWGSLLSYLEEGTIKIKNTTISTFYRGWYKE